MSQGLLVVLVLAAMAIPINCLPSRKLDGTPLASPPSSGTACTMCSSCNNPCNQRPPPPPPSPPPPPKKPSSPYCPPPPPSPYFYIIGSPGELYPIDRNHFPSVAGRNFVIEMPILLGCGLLGLLVLWRL